jgi:Lar family restriction alleviation protein
MTAPTKEQACPFCGATAGEMNITPSMDEGRKRHSWYCTVCNAEGPMHYSPEAAIAAWNRRASDAELPVGEPTDLALAAETYLIAADGFEHARRVDGETPGGADDLYDTTKETLAKARATLEAEILAARKAAR